MFRRFWGLFLVAAVLVVAATIYAIIDGKLAVLLIGAAMVASTLVGIAVLMDRRLGDAYDTGGDGRERVILRTLAAMIAAARD